MQIEILALRHQLNVLQRSISRPKLRADDRWLWIVLCRLWTNWRSALIIVKPETVLGWHRQGFRWYWTWKVVILVVGPGSVTKSKRSSGP